MDPPILCDFDERVERHQSHNPHICHDIRLGIQDRIMIEHLRLKSDYISRANVVILDAKLHFILHPNIGPYVSLPFENHISIAAVGSIVRDQLGCHVTICDKRGYRIIIADLGQKSVAL